MSKEIMQSRERVLATFANEIPDRVPIDYGANPGIDGRLKKHHGLEAKDSEGLKKALGVDFRSVGAKYTGPRLHEDKGEIQVDNWGINRRYVTHGTGGYWDYCGFPLKEATEEQIADWPMPSPDDYDYSDIPEQCDRYDEYAINGSGGYGDIINGNGMLRGMEQTLVDLITDDPAGLLLADRRMEIQIEIASRILEAAKGRVDYVHIGEDLGTQLGPMISLETFRKHIKPHYKRYCDLAKSYGAFVMMHCCGSSSWAFEDFIEIGVHVADTLQPEAANMEPAYLKETYGGRLAFHGCISTAGPVADGTVADTIEYCRDTLEIMMPGGGYCFAPTHSLQDNSPTENVVAMYETAHQYGVY
jgi:uroporphyrinogen decarboxylase